MIFDFEPWQLDINRAVQVLERAKRDALKAQDKTELIGYEGFIRMLWALKLLR